jgi:hypothetical protein
MPVTSPLQLVNAKFSEALAYSFNDPRQWALMKFTFGSKGVVELELANRKLHPQMPRSPIKALDPSAQAGDVNIPLMKSFEDHWIISASFMFSPILNSEGDIVEARFVLSKELEQTESK